MTAAKFSCNNAWERHRHIFRKRL